MSLVMAASISSCEDVPAPYQLFLEEGGGSAANDSLGKYRETPYSVAAAIKAQGSGKTGNVWVKGYIVGYIPTGGETSTTINNTVFAAPTDDMKSNIVLASSADEQVASNCMSIQLPTGEVRDSLNLKDNADKLGMEIILYGSLEKYFGAAGVKEVSFAMYRSLTTGIDPDSTFDAPHISIKEFLEKKDTHHPYEITGVASALNTQYASFDLTEDGYKIYIYRMNDAQGNKADLGALNIEEGDTVTVTGVYLAYTDKNGNVKDEINPATFVRVKKGVKQVEFERITIAKFLELKDETVAYELEGVATNINESYASFDLTQDGSSVYVYKTVDDKGNKVSLAALGVTEGSTIVVRGKYYPYVKDGVTKDEINPATFVELVSAGQGGGGEVPVGDVILDFSANAWGLPEGSGNGATASTEFTNGDYTITLAAPDKYYYNTTSNVLFLGKMGATLTLPAFDFAVARIDIVGGGAKASAATLQNIYVGETAVSTQTTGAQNTNTYEIAADYQAAGNQYTLKVESAHNTQISKIVIYKVAAETE